MIAASSFAFSSAVRRLFMVLTCLIAPLAVAQSRMFEFGEGLDYVRVRSLDTESPAASRAAMIVDLRGSTGSSPAALSRLDALLEVSAPGSIRLVLIDGSTASQLVEVLRKNPHRRLTLGAAGNGRAVNIAVATPVDLDRRARDAIDAGTSLPDLLEPKQEKRRYDEAAMVRDHANGLPIPESPPDDRTDEGRTPRNGEAKPAPNAGETKVEPLVDRVLQRAVHVHQALRALQKL